MVERKTDGDIKVLRTDASEKLGVTIKTDKSPDEVMVVLAQAFCPNGHNLIRRDDVLFDGYPGVSLWIDCGEWAGEVVISPIHGDHSRVGASKDINEGTHCTLSCPECKTPLPRIGKCRCEEGGDLVGMFLRKDLNEGEIAAICSVMGCYHSRVLDHFEILSEFIASEGDE